jgi:recombination protein RecT
MSSNNVAVAAPTRAQFGRLQDVKTIGQALAHPDLVKRFQEIAPRHLSPERLLRVMAQSIHRNPKLAECNVMSLLGAFMFLASVGLEPNTPLGEAYLIPFEKRGQVNGRWETTGVDVQVVIGYRGLINLARRSGSMKSIHADVAYEGDVFEFEYGSNQHFKHIPIGAREGRKPLWAYCYVKLDDGEAFDVLPYEDVLKIRDNSESYKSALRGKEKNTPAYTKAPWVAFEHEMVAKTMIRRLSKSLPLTIEFATAVSMDEASDRKSVDYGRLVEVPTNDLTIESVAALAEQTDEPIPTIEPEKPKPEPEKVRQTAFEQDAGPKVQAKVETKNDPKPGPTLDLDTEPQPEPAAILDDLHMYLGDETTQDGVETVWTNFEEKVELLDLHEKQEAYRIIERARRRVAHT